MELLDRYLHEIKRYLPSSQRDDIVAEIGDDVASQVEAEQERLGRPLTRDEEAELIKAYGHPKIVASRYGQPQYLIGPDLLPFYFYTLRIVAVIVVILAVFATGLGFFAAWGTLWNLSFVAIGVVTTVFAIVEFVGAKRGSVAIKWDPRALPRVGQQRVPYAQSILELVLSMIFLSIVTDVPGVRGLLAFTLGPGAHYVVAGPFRFADWWHPLASALAVVAVIQVVLSIANLVRPEWVRLRAAVQVAMYTFIICVIALKLSARPYVVLAGQQEAHHYAAAVQALNEITLAFLLMWIVIDVVLIVGSVRTLIAHDSPLRVAGG